MQKERKMTTGIIERQKVLFIYNSEMESVIFPFIKNDIHPSRNLKNRITYTKVEIFDVLEE